MEEAVLSLRELSFSYERDVKALDHVNLDVYPGERICVLGSNGAGKSTCFLNMNGVLTPDEGEVLYRGRPVDKKSLKVLHEHVGIVFQDADSQIIASTVGAEVSFGPMNLKLSREEVAARTEEALEQMNLTSYRNRPPHYLSGGEKKRVTIADIMAMRPEIIVFDEPTASLDPVNVRTLKDSLKQMSDMGKTLLISTHDVDFAYEWAERLILFSGGKMIADGDPLTIFCNGELLRQADLRKPMLLEMREQLERYKVVAEGSLYPVNMQEMENLLSKCIDSGKNNR